jgi:hypothetical protein
MLLVKRKNLECKLKGIERVARRIPKPVGKARHKGSGRAQRSLTKLNN